MMKANNIQISKTNSKANQQINRKIHCPKTKNLSRKMKKKIANIIRLTHKTMKNNIKRSFNIFLMKMTIMMAKNKVIRQNAKMKKRQKKKIEEDISLLHLIDLNCCINLLF
jgi:hypothetical protein